jgi:2-succinyl-6-hydroxy-2,4-cyclohexadiene-1-carboxylate synthase
VRSADWLLAPMGDWRELPGPLAARIAGGGPRLVFVHGFTQTGESWVPIADQFRRRGYEVAVVDLPGHGGSAGIRADLRRTADLLASTTGPATYIGYSLGGRVCLHLAIMYPHVVKRLALLSANPGIIDDDERALRRDADEELAEHITEVGVEVFIDEWVAQPLFTGLVLSADERADRLRNTAEGLSSSLRMAGTGTQVSMWERLRELNMPVFALAGELDQKFVAIAERIATSVPNATFTTIIGAGHSVMAQQPLDVVSRLEEWLTATKRRMR